MDQGARVARQAVIIEVKGNKVKLRIPGVLPEDLPEADLPFYPIKPDLGSNSGQGGKAVLQKGQFCEVEALNSAESEWIVTGGSLGFRPEGDTSGYSHVDNDKMESEIMPKLGSADAEKLKSTIHNLVNSNLINIVKGAVGAAGTEPEVPPAGGHQVQFNNADLTSDGFDKYGKTYSLASYVSLLDNNGKTIRATLNEVSITLTEATPGNINGVVNKIPTIATQEGWDIIIPSNVIYSSPSQDFVIQVEVIHKLDPTNKATGTVTVRASDIISRMIIPRAPGTAKTPQAKAEEKPSDSEKGKEELKLVQQLPNGLSLEMDGSDDNAYYSIKHPTGARIDINHAGEVTIKGSKVEMFTESTMTLNPKDILTVIVNDQVNLKAAKFYFEGDVVIDGTVNITKAVTMDTTLDVTSDIKTQADVHTSTITLNTHKHPIYSGSSAPGPTGAGA